MSTVAPMTETMTTSTTRQRPSSRSSSSSSQYHHLPPKQHLPFEKSFQQQRSWERQGRDGRREPLQEKRSSASLVQSSTIKIPSTRFINLKPLAAHIYLAIDRVQRCHVVIKRISGRDSPRVACNALSEYLIGKQLNHPNIVQTIDRYASAESL